MVHYWIAVASHEHVRRGIKEGIVQVCHGKPGPLKRMHEGDWIIYYSPTQKFGEKEPCRKFTAIGQIKSGEPYQFKMAEDFIPWRRDVHYFKSKDVEIEPLIDKLSFIKNKLRWGFPFRRGCFEIAAHDFHLIAAHMKVKIND
jgi:predicted RNA-binding protein